MLFYQQIGNSIRSSIQLEVDIPSKHEDKMPILDLMVWIEENEGVFTIMYEFYMKEVSSKNVILAISALPWSVKITVITQEALGVMMNCSRLLPREKLIYHLN